MRGWPALAAAVMICGACSEAGDKKVNEACAENSDCADAICHHGICAAANRRNEGSHCDGDGDCLSYACITNICSRGVRSEGERCLHKNECYASNCVANICQSIDGGVLVDTRPQFPGKDLKFTDLGAPDLPRKDLPGPDRGPDTRPPDLPLPDVAQPDLPQPDASPPDSSPPDSGACKGCVTTIAGGGTTSVCNYAGKASGALLGKLNGIAVDTSGTVYFSESVCHQIHTLKQSGGAWVIGTFAGVSGGGYAGGKALSARFKDPAGLALDSFGVLYVADAGNYRVRLVNQGTVAPVAGVGTMGTKNGPAMTASFQILTDLALSSSGTQVFVTEHASNGAGSVRKIATGTVSTIQSSSGPGPIAYPYGVATDSLGGVYFTNHHKNSVQRVGVTSPITIAGILSCRGIHINSAGTEMFVSERGVNHRIWRLTRSGATWSKKVYAGNGKQGLVDGPLTTAQFGDPRHLVVAAKGVIFVLDYTYSRIRMLTP